MTNTTGIPGDRICSFIERVERIDEDIKVLNEGKKEVFVEAKGEGFDVKSSGKSCASASRTKTSATNRTPCSTYISEPWRAPARRKQRRRSAKPATSFRWLNEVCAHRTSINLR
jgi:uncharacterized protein (UPF0335 family)